MIYFDHCWNGQDLSNWEQNRDVNLVKPNYYWHSSQCPAGHDKLLPALVTHIFFDIAPGEDTSGWFLSSDVDSVTRSIANSRGSTAHADWFGGWNKEINRTWVANCNNTYDAECGHGILGDPRKNPNVKALKLRKEWISGVHRIPVEDIYEQMCSASDQIPYSASSGGSVAAYCRP